VARGPIADICDIFTLKSTSTRIRMRSMLLKRERAEEAASLAGILMLRQSNAF